jgi:hypothetical protein
VPRDPEFVVYRTKRGASGTGDVLYRAKGSKLAARGERWADAMERAVETPRAVHRVDRTSVGLCLGDNEPETIKRNLDIGDVAYRRSVAREHPAIFDEWMGELELGTRP